MKFFLDNTMSNMTAAQQQANDKLLKDEIELVKNDSSQAEYLKALKHISSFYRPIYTTSICDKDLLIQYYLKSNQQIFSSGHAGSAIEASQSDLKNHIKQRTYINMPGKDHFDYHEEIIKLSVFGVGFIIAGIVLSVLTTPVFSLVALIGVPMLLASCLLVLDVLRDTSDYLERVKPHTTEKKVVLNDTAETIETAGLDTTEKKSALSNVSDPLDAPILIQAPPIGNFKMM